MAIERTFAMIKPDAVARGITGQIISMIEENGFRIVAMKKHHISQKEAEGFYYVHKARPFFGGLTDFMSSGPCIVMCLEAEGAIKKWRDLMGATNPKQAAAGTIRADFASSIEENVVHGSDGTATAATEIAFFFSEAELCPRA